MHVLGRLQITCSKYVISNRKSKLLAWKVYIEQLSPSQKQSWCWVATTYISEEYIFRENQIEMISVSLTLTNYIYAHKPLFWTYDFLFLRKAALCPHPFWGSLGHLVQILQWRQKAMVGWTPQVVNWWTINIQSWRDTNSNRTVLLEGKNKCSCIVSWCTLRPFWLGFLISETGDCTVCIAL